ncbi:hypothetical protein SASPL_139886 [Salvia splendens]|uniref:Chitinase n=1 Tax=Salvia splendens TaxID=180675 RepID=A0A8X8ZB37_SALSN|nr:hypothetical protein SASPL_139886 [Salvia splendens]
MAIRRVFAAAITALLLLELGSACSNGACKVGDDCSSGSDCGPGLYCLSCEVEGSKCVRTTATNQFSLLNNSLPFNKYAFLTTHNAFAIEDGQPRLTFTNQEDNITQQLNDGVRALMLDIYDFEGDIWLCHSFGGQCYDYTKFEPAINTLREIEAFMSRNPSEIVTIILEDYVKTPKGLTKVFTNAGLMKYWFPLSKMPKNGDGDDGMKDKCFNRGESSVLSDTSKSLILVNYFRSVPMKLLACVENSVALADMLHTCHAAAGNRWANFVAVDYYKRSKGGGAFEATDLLNGELLCGCNDVHSCVVSSFISEWCKMYTLVRNMLEEKPSEIKSINM